MVLAKHFLLLTLIAFFIAGCGEDTVTPVNPPGNSHFISGSITDYPGGNMVVKAKLNDILGLDSFFAGIDTVDTSGELGMDLTAPPAGFLISFNTTVIPPGIVISDTTALTAQFALLRTYDLSNNLTGRLQKKNFNDSSAVLGSFTINYYYSKKPFTITGSDTAINASDTSISSFNLNLSTGWNVFTFMITEKRANFTKYGFTSGETPGGSWRYSPVTFDILQQRKILFY